MFEVSAGEAAMILAVVALVLGPERAKRALASVLDLLARARRSFDEAASASPPPTDEDRS